MPGFLEKLSRQIYADHKEHLGDICLVLPNRRASLFIRQELSKLIEKTSFLPEFFSIEDFVVHMTGQLMADQLGLQFRLFDIHKRILGSQSRSIDEFLPYAAWMITDFNEIDMYLVDANKLFTHLGDLKEMTLWNPDGRELNDFEKRYLSFMRSIGDYYTELHKELGAEKLAYQGMAFRQLAENIEGQTENMPWQKVIFAGFNALTSAEETIIRHMLDAGKADVYWDADKYYTDQGGQEAGVFLREYFKNLNKGDVNWVGDAFSSDKNIEVIGVPKNTGQVKYAGEIIQKIAKEQGNLQRTALVLPDEGLLIPMLNSIPEEAGEFNVTMGLPLRSTPLYSLLNNILLLNINAFRLSEMNKGQAGRYYSRDLIRVFNHPWLRMLNGGLSEEEDIVGRIRNTNRVILLADNILELLSETHPLIKNPEYLFTAENNPGSLLTTFSGLLRILRTKMIKQRADDEGSHRIEMEYLFHFNGLIVRLQDLLKKYSSINTLKTLHMIFRQLAGQERIPFHGEPLKGLQVMGMLETRTLDFDTLIMLSVNEGTLPSARMHNSFIPHEIKKTYGLPTYRHNNKVFAYHFYRLLQRAQNTYLLFNTVGGELGGGEKSRYITQLLHELPRYNPNIRISEHFLTMPPPAGIRDNSILIEKDEAVMALLRKEAGNGLHTSSLNLFINCPLQFYLTRLLNIKETEEAEETIDNRILGIVLHNTLKELLEDHINKPLTSETLRHLKKEVEGEVNRQFRETMAGGDLKHGKNFLILNVANKMLKQLLERETEWLSDDKELILKNLEKRFEHSITTETSGSVKFQGIIDRVDTKGGLFRVLDYKTGFIDEKELKVKDLDEVIRDPKYSKAFQLLMYSWIFHNNMDTPTPLQAGILSLRMPGKGPVMLKLMNKEVLDQDILNSFEEKLTDLLGDLFDPGQAFKQAEDEANCRYCSFKEMCNRNTPVDYY